jgi:hypothetical protein
MKKLLLSSVAVLGLLTGRADAQSVVYTSQTVGTSSAQILAQGTARVFLDVINLSSTNTVCINFAAAATITGTACGAGEITLPPLWHRSWEGVFIPGEAINAIASGSGTSVSVGAK